MRSKPKHKTKYSLTLPPPPPPTPPPPPPPPPPHHHLAPWNARYLLENPRSNRPEGRAALVARELARYKVHIANVGETLFSEQGQLEEVGAGCTIFGSGRPKAERRDADVAFAFRSDIMRRLSCLPQGINHRLISLRQPLRGEGGRLDSPRILVMTAAELRSRSAATSAGRAGDQGYLRHRWLVGPPPRHLHDIVSSRLEDLSAAAADKNASVEILWCRLWDAVHSTALGVLGRARRQHEDWFDENDVDMSNLAAERNRLRRAYPNRQTDANRRDINKCTRLAEQQLR
ncbi:hypothetical protein SprV_0501810500 [Sparganum proliferum]